MDSTEFEIIKKAMSLVQAVNPKDVIQSLSEENNDNIGGTIRDGSSDEQFVIGSLIFNVERARKIAGDKANGRVEVSNDWSTGINVNEDHALNGTKDKPVFIGMIPTENGNEALLFDGHHRMYRAMANSEKDVEAFIFTPEQTLSCLSAPPDLMMKLRMNMRDGKKKPVRKDLMTGTGQGSMSIDNMQSIIEGVDWEMSEGAGDEETAQELALANLSTDNDYYKKKFLELRKDTQEDEEGYNIDIGSGHAREPGFIGLDLYPFDSGTAVHDIETGIPFGDETCQRIRMSNVPVDPKPLLADIQRALRPGGQFTYEGPNEIFNYPEFMEEVGKETIDKGADQPGWTKQTFKRKVMPDAATSQDSEPRVGIQQYDMLPADALLAMDAIGYQWSDATSSGRGNRAHGYPSQGALVNKEFIEPVKLDPSKKSEKLVELAKTLLIEARHRSIPEAECAQLSDAYLKDMHAALVNEGLDQANDDLQLAIGSMAYRLTGKPTFIQGSATQEVNDYKLKIVKSAKMKQLVYCVVLAPNEADLQDDFLTAEEIEKSAHNYIIKSRVVGAQHSEPMNASVVESYIAPVDFEINGQYGPQKITKGTWVLGIKVNDPKEWQKVIDGTYTGLSVGGLGARDKRDTVTSGKVTQ